MNEKKVRLHYIDIARAISILLLVWGHTLGHSENSKYIYKIIYSFVVPLFFVVSGFLMSPKGAFGYLAKNKFVRIMIPYFIWAVLFLVPFYMFGSSVASSFDISQKDDLLVVVKNILYGIGKDHRLQQNASLWFLPALYTMSLFYHCVFYLLDKFDNDKVRIGAAVVLMIGGYISDRYLVISLPWGLNTVFVAGVYFYLGHLLRRYKVIEQIMSNKYRSLVLVIAGMLGMYAGSTNRALGFMDYNIGNVWLAYISGICFSVLMLCLAYSIGKCSLLEYVGKNTMSVMIFHKLPILLCQTKLGMLTQLLTASNIFIEVMLSTIVAIGATFFALAVGEVLKRIAPFTIGENEMKKKKLGI